MTSEIIKLETASQFNAIKGVETRHPLVSVFNYDDADQKVLPNGRYQYGFYAVFLKEAECGVLTHGRNTYDYEVGTLVFIGRGKL